MNTILKKFGSVFIVATMLCAACEDDDAAYRAPVTEPSVVAPSIEKQKHKKRATTGPVAKTTTKVEDGLIKLPPLDENSFVVGPKRRDPFLPFIEMLIKPEELHRMVQRDVKLKEYDVSDLKLVAIITNIGDPKAMVIPPDGTGFVLRRGDYVGRADYIKQGAKGETIQVNWKVARIHGSGQDEDRGIYLVRDDPTTSKTLDATKFIPLHPRN